MGILKMRGGVGGRENEEGERKGGKAGKAGREEEPYVMRFFDLG